MSTLKDKFGIHGSTAVLVVIAALYCAISTFARADEAEPAGERAPASEQVQETERAAPAAPQAVEERAPEPEHHPENTPSESAI